MFTILICDDDLNDAAKLESGIRSFFQKHEWNDLQVILKTSPSDLNIHMQDARLLLLDIQLQDQSGIEYAKKLRKQGIQVPIIFISSSHEYLKEGYHVNALRYITKPYSELELEQEISEILFTLHDECDSITIPQLPFEPLYIRDIQYIEIYQHISELHTTFGIYKIRLSLKEWEALLQGFPFAKPNKSFLIHFPFIKSINKADITLQDEQICTLTRRFKLQFQEKYYTYLMNL